MLRSSQHLWGSQADALIHLIQSVLHPALNGGEHGAHGGGLAVLARFEQVDDEPQRVQALTKLVEVGLDL